ncbi:MAG TPA: hypothetical protein VLB75_12610 [Steroidobacteraceae bacterium]|nr:hypothetical protein [Steroidobacteraceae bacterium]
MRTGLGRRIVAVIVVASFFITSCASFQNVQLPTADQPTATPAVNVGDTVEATTREGAKRRFKVTAVESDGLVGQDVRVAYKDMTSLRVERQSASSGKTTAWIIVGVVAVAAIAAAAGGGGGGSSY